MAKIENQDWPMAQPQVKISYRSTRDTVDVTLPQSSTPLQWQLQYDQSENSIVEASITDCSRVRALLAFARTTTLPIDAFPFVHVDPKPIDDEADVRSSQLPNTLARLMTVGRQTAKPTGADYKSPEVDEFFVRWAGGKQIFEQLIASWQSKKVLESRKQVSPWGDGVAKLLNVLIKLKRNAKDTTMRGSDDRFIPLTPTGTLWWLQSKLNVEWPGKVAAGRKFQALHRRAHHFRHYVNLITDDRKDTAFVAWYEARAQASGMEPWYGELPTRIVERAKHLRDNEERAEARVPKRKRSKEGVIDGSKLKKSKLDT